MQYSTLPLRTAGFPAVLETICAAARQTADSEAPVWVLLLLFVHSFSVVTSAGKRIKDVWMEGLNEERSI